jgi:hypothetical protein
MKARYFMVCMLVLGLTSLFSHKTDSTKTRPAAKGPSKVYYGGTIGLNFGSYFRLSMAPLVGCKLNPKASPGVGVGF